MKKNTAISKTLITGIMLMMAAGVCLKPCMAFAAEALSGGAALGAVISDQNEAGGQDTSLPAGQDVQGAAGNDTKDISAGEDEISDDAFLPEAPDGQDEMNAGMSSDKTQAQQAPEVLTWDDSWEYASYSIIHTGSVTLYHSPNRDTAFAGTVVAVNAGHGTQGGSSVETQCHPDGSPKVTGGSTEAGAITATAVSTGTTMLDGTAGKGAARSRGCA